jgi:hypothetical protein
MKAYSVKTIRNTDVLTWCFANKKERNVVLCGLDPVTSQILCVVMAQFVTPIWSSCRLVQLWLNPTFVRYAEMRWEMCLYIGARKFSYLHDVYKMAALWGGHSYLAVCLSPCFKYLCISISEWIWTVWKLCHWWSPKTHRELLNFL